MSASNGHTKEEDDKSELLLQKLVELSKTVCTKYPSDVDYRYFCSYPEFNDESNSLSNNILTTLNKLCQFVNPNGNDTVDLLSERNEYLRWQTISDSADHCIEQVDLCLDQIKEQNINQSLNSLEKHNYNQQNSYKQSRLFVVMYTV